MCNRCYVSFSFREPKACIIFETYNLFQQKSVQQIVKNTYWSIFLLKISLFQKLCQCVMFDVLGCIINISKKLHFFTMLVLDFALFSYLEVILHISYSFLNCFEHPIDLNYPVCSIFNFQLHIELRLQHVNACIAETRRKLHSKIHSNALCTRSKAVSIMVKVR